MGREPARAEATTLQKLVLSMIVIVTTINYFRSGDHWGRMAWLPTEVGYLPELLSAMALIYILAVGPSKKFSNVRPAYWFVFGAVVVTISFSSLANGSGAGEMFTGLRAYVRALPFFILPCVFHYSDRQIATQLKVLLAIAVIQLPIAIEQRIKTASGSGGFNISGDHTSGTLQLSSTLTIFLICGLSLCAAFVMRKHTRRWRFVFLGALLFLPTTINETKITLILLPVCLLTTLVFGLQKGVKLRAVMWLFLVLSLAGSMFWVTYDYLGQSHAGERERTLSKWVTDEEKRQALFTKESELGGDIKGGRWDAVIVPLKYLSKDPVHLFLGLGIGSVADSALGAAFVGRYHDLFEPFLRTAFPRLILELGLIGVGLVAMLYLLILSDCRYVAAHGSGLMRTVALGWIGATTVMGITIFYMDSVPVASLSYLFWYLSGLVASARMRLHFAST